MSPTVLITVQLIVIEIDDISAEEMRWDYCLACSTNALQEYVSWICCHGYTFTKVSWGLVTLLCKVVIGSC